MSWTHYVFLMAIENAEERRFYYFDRHVKTESETPTVGIVLCKKKHEALVEITLPKDANIHASEYQLYLPSKEALQQKLTEWAAVLGNE